MNKKELKEKIQQSFLELAPDVYNQVKDAPLPRVDSADQLHENRIKQGNGGRSWYQQRNWRYYVSAVAVCLLLFVFVNVNNQENIYVGMDVNPSIRIVLDKNYTIKRVEGLNEDGKEFTKKLNMEKKCSLSDGIENIVNTLYEQNYLENNSVVLMTLCEKNASSADALKTIIEDELQSSIEKVNVKSVVVAFQQTGEKPVDSGRELLERNLVEQYGFTKEACEKLTIEELLESFEKKSGNKLDSEVIYGKRTDEKVKTTEAYKEAQPVNKLTTELITETVKDTEDKTTEQYSEEHTTEVRKEQTGNGNGSSNGNIGNGQMKDKTKDKAKDKERKEKKEKKEEKTTKEKTIKEKKTKEKKTNKSKEKTIETE